MLRVARQAMRMEGCDPEAEVTIVIGGDKWIRRLNREYRGADRATDVLAFPADLERARGRGGVAFPQPERAMALGDVAISAQTAERQARTMGHSLSQELALLVAHGILHLTGWKDDTPRQRQRMMQRAREVLKEAGLSGPG